MKPSAKELIKDIRSAINEGKLIAVCGLVGSGKTVTLRRLQQILEEEKKVTVSRYRLPSINIA